MEWFTKVLEFFVIVFNVLSKILEWIYSIFITVNNVLSGVIDSLFRKSMNGWKIPLHLFVVMLLINSLVYGISLKIPIPLEFELLQSIILIVALVSTAHGWWGTYRRSKRAGL